MDRKSVRIVFMGTPEFAEYSLKRLVDGGFNVVGVVTVPDKPIGRHGSVLQPSPVKQYALSCGIPVLQPVKLKDPEFLAALRGLYADLQIVVAFRMLPEEVWAMPRLGTFNLHASLLPKYRGAAPINWAVINGESETGVTTFFLQHDIDTGDIIDQVSIPVGCDDDAGSVHNRLMETGAELLLKTADSVIDGSATTYPQPTVEGDGICYAPKIFKDTCRIDWKRDAITVKNLVRGLSPYPAAWSVLHLADGTAVDFKIFKVSISETSHNVAPGSIITDGKTYLDVVAADGLCVRLLDVQMAGKKRMPAQTFLCGTHLSDICHFE